LIEKKLGSRDWVAAFLTFCSSVFLESLALPFYNKKEHMCTLLISHYLIVLFPRLFAAGGSVRQFATSVKCTDARNQEEP